ncbi:unnamed protein product [Rotaria sp. Silwood1]|nr:unnamed protein product [Rotaria sp. Silwood1]
MNEREILILLIYIKVVLLGSSSIASLFYALSICFIRRFHNSIHFLSANVSIAVFICCTYWSIYFFLNTFYPNILWSEQSCLFIIYLQTATNFGVVWALCVISLNRLFAVVYQNKIFFRTKRWTIVCISTQWILTVLLASPHFALDLTHCLTTGLDLNHLIYDLFIIAIIPAIFLAVTNTIIFKFVRRSTQRVQPINNENAIQHHTFSRRDIHLLKHIFFMLISFFLSWIPIYITGTIYDVVSVSHNVYHGILLLPAIGFVADAIDLFAYNHELRRYFIDKIRSWSNQ